MEIRTLPLGEIGVNCYLISSNNGAVVIDPGYKSEEVLNFLKENQNKERLILLTHNHFDHIGFALELSRLTDTKIAIGKLDNDGLSNPQINLATLFGSEIEPFSADMLLDDNDKISVGNIKFTVLHTPGHTVGGVCYLLSNNIFAGDTLFCESIGRTDFPGGNFETIKKSILNLYEFEDDMIVYPGHGPSTSIGYEKLCNPYVRVI
jgi:glyoxylase-like metal-dependent hydrolase (beta-lactamase superfamily II)